MSAFFGRKALLDRIDDLLRSNQHVSVVGPRSMGKTVLLKAVVDRHAKGSDVFSGAGLVDLRHDPPGSTADALRRVGGALQAMFRGAVGGQFAYLAAEIDLAASTEELYDQLKIALDMVGESDGRLLLVLDGCDAVLQNSAIPRNLWDNLRALAQSKALRLMTGSRAQLHLLCYNPDARTSDFFRIFYDQPLQVGPFDDGDWKDVFSGCGFVLDGSAEKELRNWTGGHPDLVALLLARMKETSGNERISKAVVDAAAEGLIEGGSARLDALWMDCPDEVRGDVIQLARGEMLASEVPTERLRFLTEHGIAAQSGNKARLINRFVERLVVTRKTDVSGARQLFERPEDFASNIRTVLELRLAHMEGADSRLFQFVRRSIRHLPDDPAGALGSARDILDRALDLVWEIEAPGGRVPQAWINHWRAIEAATNRRIQAASDYGQDPSIPEERGRQCALLRLATGQQRVRPIAAKVSKGTCVLIEHMNQIGDLKNHSRGDPTLIMAVSFSFAAIELCEALKRELG